MTTTLRPAGPEQHAPDSARSRGYDICVNGRRAGTVELSAHQEYGSAVGRITRLTVDPADRRRARATVAALAAEEVLRGWGCRRIDIGIPAAAGRAPLRLAAALGYTRRKLHLLKELPEAAEPEAGEDGPRLPSGCAVRPMTTAEYPEWLEHDRAELMPVLIENGCPREEAAAAAERAHRLLLPDGPATAGMRMLVLEDGKEPVGTLLVRVEGVMPRPDAGGWVYTVRVAEDRRGRGHGRSLMLAAERESGAAGVRTLGLNVLADNTAAQGLYASLGYHTAEVHLAKPLL